MDFCQCLSPSSFHILTTETSTYLFKKSLPSNSKVMYSIYEKDFQSYLVKYYNHENSSKDLEREKKFVNIFLLNKDFSLSIYEKNCKTMPYFLIYSLDDYVALSEQINSIPSQSRETLILKLINTVSEIHSLKMIHSTLNLENIFINKNFDIKIIGFENCLEIEELASIELKNYFEHQEKYYKAPEILRAGYEIGPKIDIWSLGLIIYQILFPGSRIEKYDEGKSLIIDSIEDSKIKRTFEMIFNPDPMLRVDLKTLKILIRNPPNEKIFQLSNKFTYDLVKLFMIDKASTLPIGLLAELVDRIRENHSRVRKFKQAFMERRLRYPRKILKALFLLHWIWNNLGRDDCGPLDNQMFEKVINDYKSNQSEEFQVIINCYFDVLKLKVELVREFHIKPNFKFAGQLGNGNKKLRRYLKLIIDFVSIILFRFKRNSYLEEVAKLLSQEIIHIIHFFLKNFDSMDKRKTFFRLRSMTEELIQALYQNYPGINLMIKTPLYLRFNIQPLPSDRSKWINRHLIKNQKHFKFGSTSQIFRASYKGKIIAIKSLPIDGDHHRFKIFKREQNFIENLVHENIVTYLGYFKDKTHNIVTEFCAGNSLDTLLELSTKSSLNFNLTLKQKVKIAMDIANGLDYLHSQTPALMHRNLTSSSILLACMISSPFDIPKAKIADFGKSNVHHTEGDSNLLGSSIRMAPEVYKGRKYNEKCDIYSFGFLLWEIFSQDASYDKFNTVDNINENNRPNIDAINDEQMIGFKAIIQNCWNDNPAVRPSCKVILEELKKLTLMT